MATILEWSGDGTGRQSPMRFLPQGLSSAERHRGKQNAVFYWLVRFHYASLPVLQRVLGLRSSATTSRLLSAMVKEGLLVTRQHPAILRPLYVLTRKGRVTAFKRAHEYKQTYDFVYRAYPSSDDRILPGNAAHDLAVQVISVDYLAETHDLVPARLFVQHEDAMLEEEIVNARHALEERITEVKEEREVMGDDYQRAEALYLDGFIHTAPDHERLLARWGSALQYFEAAGKFDDPTDMDSKLYGPYHARIAELEALQTDLRTTVNGTVTQRPVKIPDLILIHEDGSRIAMEVERTPKGIKDIRTAIERYQQSLALDRYQAVHIVCADDCIARGYRKVLKEFPDSAPQFEVSVREDCFRV